MEVLGEGVDAVPAAVDVLRADRGGGLTMVLVLAEHDRGTLNDLSLQAMALGRQLARAPASRSMRSWSAATARSLAATLGAHGAATVHVADHEG